MAAKSEIDYNSLISWATDSRFCMEVCMDSLNKFWQSFEIQNCRQKTKWPPNHKIMDNSLISWVTESRLRMEVCMDSLNKFWFLFLKNNMATKKQNGRQMAKLSITHSFLELQTPDFAWNFQWTVWSNLDFFLIICWEWPKKISQGGKKWAPPITTKAQQEQKAQPEQKMHFRASYEYFVLVLNISDFFRLFQSK